MTKKTIIVAAVLLLAAVLFVGAGAAAGDANEDTGVAKIGDQYYSTLAYAVENASDGDTITMLKDVSLSTRVPIYKKVTLDLAGYKISVDTSKDYSNPTSALIGVGYGGDLTIKDSSGTQTGKITTGIVAPPNGDRPVYAAVTMTIKNDGKDNTNPAKLTVESGTLEGWCYAISGNGGRQNTEITINGGNIMGLNEGSTGIYHPQAGKLTINGGTISGGTGIYIKSGNLEVVNCVSGGKIIGHGSYNPYEPSPSGFSSTGDAIVIDNCGYPGGEPFVSITDGEFHSDNAKAVGCYADGDHEKLKNFIKGGTFNTEVTEYIAPGYADRVKIVKSDSIDVTYDVSDSFILTIPSDLNFNTATEIHDKVNITINSLTAGKSVNLTMKSQNFVTSDNFFKLKLPTGDAIYSYVIKCADIPLTPAESNILMTTDETAEKSMTFTLGTTTSKVAGSYKDVLTFIADVVDTPTN